MPETRPTYHFTSPTGMDCEPFDPNGAIFWKGRYHLGYIVGYYDECSKHFWWGHVSSTDLIDWKMHPPMLSPYPGDPDKGIFSGNALVDKKGRVVLHYHGVDAGNCIAVNEDDDELDSFVKLAANPVMKDPGWDPFGWLEDGVYYSISGSHPEEPGTVPSLYKCTDDDQAEWTLVGDFMSHDMPDVEADEDLSGPDLFQLGDKRVLLCISHKRGARYYFGRFENEQFYPEEHHRMNWIGGDCFALETLLDDRGRRIFWAWAIGSPSSMTLPRVLSMREDGTMGIEPVEELDALRRNHRRLEPGEVEPDVEVDLDGVSGDCMELRVAIDPQRADQCGVKLRCSPDGEEQTAVVYDAAEKVLRIDLAKSSLDSEALPTTFVMVVPNLNFENPRVTAQEAPFELGPDEALDLRIYLDRSVLEVFANGRQCLTQRIYPTREDSLGVRLFSLGEAATFTAIDAWDMSPITIR
ncbi:MAG TPA: glycoside hydrolase family 32 protein [Solirubrobacterales bacterium]|nr:glycoside hydrolase family 32 protein [Solirubrobacterales bacterium]